MHQKKSILFQVPGFTDEENVAAIRCLVATGMDEMKAPRDITGGERNGAATTSGEDIPEGNNDDGEPGVGQRGELSMEGSIREARVVPADPAASAAVSQEQATLMWRAAHFYQADRLKVKCEDAIMAGLRKVAADTNYGASKPSPYGDHSSPYGDHSRDEKQQQQHRIVKFCLYVLIEHQLLS